VGFKRPLSQVQASAVAQAAATSNVASQPPSKRPVPGQNQVGTSQAGVAADRPQVWQHDRPQHDAACSLSYSSTQHVRCRAYMAIQQLNDTASTRKQHVTLSADA
jgi:hypothetical protein